MDYRIYFLDEQNHFRAAEAIECVSDKEAIKLVQKTAKEQRVELWQGNRRVALVIEGEAQIISGPTAPGTTDLPAA